VPSKGILYGIFAVLAALLVVSASVAVLYYGEYQTQVSQNQQSLSELRTALSNYDSLARSYNSSLRDYNSTLSLLATAVANLNTTTPAYRNASLALTSLWNSYLQLSSFSGRNVLTYGVHMLVYYENGSVTWYNDTMIQPGWNAYVVTLVLLNGRVGAIWYPEFQEHLVLSLNGVSSGQSDSWFVWVRNGNQWKVSPTGAEGIPIYNETVFAWTLCGYDSSFNPTCTP
jgi:hypothetical protein